MHVGTLLVALLVAAPPAEAGPWALRADLAVGGAVLAPPLESQTWGYVACASAGVRFTELLWLIAFAERGDFPLRQPSIAATAYGAALVYDLDLAPFVPFVEAGVARVSLTTPSGAGLIEWVPRLAFGVELSIGWLVLGAAVRYYPLFDSDVLGSPASTAVTLRMGARWQATTVPTERTSR